jgi:hypothetical protein
MASCQALEARSKADLSDFALIRSVTRLRFELDVEAA